MRFVDVRQVAAPPEVVWAGLHDPAVLRRVIPGCEEIRATGPGRYAATLSARVGRLADTYRGSFGIDDLDEPGPARGLVVRVAARGRCGRLDLDLRVRLSPGRLAATTTLAYDATARVGGMVARLGCAPLTVAGGHLTGRFFHDLDRAVSRPHVPTQRAGTGSAAAPRTVLQASA